MTQAGQDIMAGVEAVSSLRELNDQLTTVMAARRVQELIQGEKLTALVTQAQLLCDTSNAEDRILLAAVLGRMGAVARGRSCEVFSGFDRWMVEEPAPLETLQDGDEKAYAAAALNSLKCPAPKWLLGYVVREAFETDSAENARKTLLAILRDRSDDYMEVMHQLTKGFGNLLVDNPDARLRRVKRILEAWKEVSQDHFWELDSNPGEVLSNVVKMALRGVKTAKEEELVAAVADLLFELLLRAVQLRFSYALEAPTYLALSFIKAYLGARHWSYIRANSKVKLRLLACLREACLVLARQGQTDAAMLDAMKVMYPTRTSMSNDLKAHFEGHQELDDDVSAWWTSGGTKRLSSSMAHSTVKADEDMLIGQLLLESESANPSFGNVRSNLVPLIEEFDNDPVMSSSLNKGLNSFSEISRIVRQLCRMRKLELAGLEQEVITYNRTRHEMEGGHQPGIKQVIVLRDQVVQKTGDRERIVVKAIVDPI